MPRSKKSKITSLSNNVFGLFIGLALGCGASIGNPLAWSVCALVAAMFVWWRFGIGSLTMILIAFLIGYCSRFITSTKTVSEPLDGVVISSRQNYLILLSKGHRIYVSIKDNPYQLGDFIRVSGQARQIDFPSLESQFDFETYLHQKGVFFEIGNAQITDIFLFPIRLVSIKEKFLSSFTAEDGDYLRLLLFNDPLEDSLHDKLDILSIVHITRTSGLLVYGVMTIIGKFFGLFMTEKKASNFASVILIPWLALNPSSVAIWRSILLRVFSILAIKSGKPKESYWAIRGIIGIIMLLVSKYLVYSPAFYLSFTLSALLHLRNKRRPTKLATRLANRAIPMMLMLPYTAVAIGHLNLVSYLLFIPMLFVNSLLALLAIIQAITFPLSWVLRPLINLCYLLINIGGWLRFTIHFPDLSTVVIIACIMMLIMWLLVLELRVWNHVRHIQWLMLMFFAITIIPIGNLWRQEVHFINVGQGDAILIKNRSHAILVDTGGSRFIDIAAEVLIPYFHRQGVSRLDAVIVTHDDFDHNGALEKLRGGFPVDKVVTDRNDFPMTLAGITFDNLNLFPPSGVDDNLGSLVLYFRFMNKDWLLMGDAPLIVEEAIIVSHQGLSCDYIKIGHHGSNTSSSASFIDSIGVKEAVISVGRNYYGHPHPEVLERLEESGIIVRRTDEEGTIVYKNTFAIV